MTIKFTAVIATILVAAVVIAFSPAIADQPVTDTSKLATALSSTARLLELMDTDKNGKVSK